MIERNSASPSAACLVAVYGADPSWLSRPAANAVTSDQQGAAAARCHRRDQLLSAHHGRLHHIERPRLFSHPRRRPPPRRSPWREHARVGEKRYIAG